MRIALLLLAAVIAAPVYSAKVGGKLALDGQEIHIDFPDDLHKANTSSRGQGCCVFRSLHHASHWHRIPALHDFPEWLQKKGLPGGGYPGNVEARITAICKERGVKEPAYIQIFGTVEDDLKILEKACKSGRMPCVTYGISPTRRYGGGRIAHMVNIVHADLSGEGSFTVLDNNYIGVAKYEHMTRAEFIRAYTSGGRAGWSVILLADGPPPIPWN